MSLVSIVCRGDVVAKLNMDADNATLFSVVIPTYNRHDLLVKTLTSIAKQEFKNYETIIVDDGSTDDTSALLQSLNDRVRSYRSQNGGPGAARNLGASHASGTYLAFLDSDDVWLPWTLDTYANLIAQYHQPAFIAGQPFRFSHESQLKSLRPETIKAQRFQDYYASGNQWRWWGASSFVIRRDAFLAAGGFTSQWVNGEDADLAMRLGDAAGFVQVFSPATFGYREHDVSAMKNFERTLAGCRLKLQAELAGQYPGGPQRQFERRRILSRHLRPVSLECLRLGLHKEAWELYRSTFAWNVTLRRWKYLVGFPLRAIRS